MPDTLRDSLVAPFVKLVESWKQDASRIRTLAPRESIPDTLDQCAREVLEAIEKAKTAGETLSTAEWAKLYGKDVQTVRRYIRDGRLEAELVGGEYRIAVDAQVVDRIETAEPEPVEA